MNISPDGLTTTIHSTKDLSQSHQNNQTNHIESVAHVTHKNLIGNNEKKLVLGAQHRLLEQVSKNNGYVFDELKKVRFLYVENLKLGFNVNIGQESGDMLKRFDMKEADVS